MITVGVKIRTTRVFFDTGGFLPCRVLSEDDPKEKSELSTNDTCAFNENELKAKFEFSAAGKCNILRKYISITKKGEHDEQRTGKDLRPQRNGRSYL